MSKEQASVRLGCGAVLFIGVVLILFLGALGSSITMGGR